MGVFATIIACVLVLAFSVFILVTLYTIVRDLLRRSKRKASLDNNNDSRKEEGK